MYENKKKEKNDVKSEWNNYDKLSKKTNKKHNYWLIRIQNDKELKNEINY